jgi:hypothetical protein
MTSSPEPKEDIIKNGLFTPKVNYDQRNFLSPPPAPMGGVYDGDMLTDPCSNRIPSDQRHTPSRRTIHAPLLEFPSILLNIDLEAAIKNEGQRRGDKTPSSVKPVTRQRQVSRRGRTRSNSFDIMPLPRISLRPRFTRNLPPPDSLSRRGQSFHGRRPHEEEGKCLDCTNTRNHIGPTHLRSHSYSGDSSIYDAALSEELAPPLLPSIPSGIDMTSLGCDLPPISPPHSVFGYPAQFKHDGISKPKPRYSDGRRLHSPQEEKRPNSSEATTICTLASSNNSAFDTPIKRSKNPNSPLTSGSDSTSPSGAINDEISCRGQIYDKLKSAEFNAQHFFPQCAHDSDDNNLLNFNLSQTARSRTTLLPFDEVHLHRKSKQQSKDDCSS